ncbi:N-acetylmuramoyl-L-alanine amidase [Bacillus toyonensis]|uniref:N-acetylmuramoyl-L-alanine amidase n=1 Tax=Bacillus toyonensis TaxID=155322 RepID=A0A2C4MLU0_9BACI|nr:N-acetylmuramoyl-L-alanine amidase [Bacillus toyonensis]PEL18332.1 N-acetylmuramoyl-L-alanine amidase [Bacillus toyonensis]PEO40046.1 N-acetylmuramoyl-L-alanine amidase [Bacillus toyonensis]PFY28383.1 N-acetylmuramoyl-L-alanine amidase [Bacillus toyonensis]PFY29233.1 N-acetylmuramoyl-L-alanine amidase [Bacillus toyonensis]
MYRVNYNKPSWKDGDVAGTVNAGEGFTIDAKIMLNGAPQYRVHNSKGKTFYVTASQEFVYIQ